MDIRHLYTECSHKTVPKFVVTEKVKIERNSDSCDSFYCVNENLAPFRCKSCNFDTYLIVDLNKHFKNGHKFLKHSVDCHECECCGFRTFSHFSYEIHRCNKQYFFEYLKHIKPDTAKTKSVQWQQREQWTGDKKWLQRDQCDAKTFKVQKLAKPFKYKQCQWFRCNDCPYKSWLKSNLQNHLVIRHTAPENINWFHCEHCPFKSKVKTDLRRHLFRKHGFSKNVNWLHCEHCPYKSKEQFNLTRHKLRAHAPEDVKWFQCEHCRYKSRDKSNFNRHSTKHGPRDKKGLPLNKKRFECEHCAYTSIHSSALRKHKINRHTPLQMIKWFKCEQCPSTFKLKGDLRMHQRTQHTDPDKIVWFECKICGFLSKVKSNLNKHVRTKHGEPKWLYCANCTFKTTNKRCLRTHVGRCRIV